MSLTHAVAATVGGTLFSAAALLWLGFCVAAMPNTRPGPREWSVALGPCVLSAVVWVLYWKQRTGR